MNIDLDLAYTDDAAHDGYICPACNAYVDEYGDCYCSDDDPGADFEPNVERFSADEMAMLRS